jgi:hypothetical protein
MVVEIRPWSSTGRLGLNLWNGCEPFFPFNNHPSQSYGPHPHNMSMVAQPLMSCQSRGKLTTDLWQFAQKKQYVVLAFCSMVVRPLAYCSRHSRIYRYKGTLLICHSRLSRSRLVAKSPESGEPVFTLWDVPVIPLLYGLALRWPIFKQKRVRDH